MHFRWKKSKGGQVLQLIEAYRNSEGLPRNRVVVSLGSPDIPLDSFKIIAKGVDNRLHGRMELDLGLYSAEESEWIERIIKKIDRDGRWSQLNGSQKTHKQVLDGVIVEEVTHTNTTFLGPSWVGWEAFKRLKLPESLQALGFSGTQIKAAAISIINRLVDPVSEHALQDWYQNTSLPELLDEPNPMGGADRFYRVADKLLAHKEKVEDHLRQAQLDLFKTKRSIVLYDLTNTHFEGSALGNQKAKRGINKQKRHDCPQVVIGMVFDELGFPLTHQVFEGSFSDSKSLERMMSSLEKATQGITGKPLVIMDAGVATKDNLAMLRDKGFYYLVNGNRSRRKDYQEAFAEESQFTTIKLGKGSVQVRCIKENPNSPELLILCKSALRADKEKAMLSKAEDRFLADLERLVSRVAKGRLVCAEKIQRAIGKLQARHPRVARYYIVTYEDEGAIRRVRYERKDIAISMEDNLHGCYVLRTDYPDLSSQEIWMLYMNLLRAESGFKALKSDLGLRPNFHQKEDRVEAHIWITVLAYHLQRVILCSLENCGDYRSWNTINRILSTHCYTTILLPTTQGTMHRIRKAGIPEEEQEKIYNRLGMQVGKVPSSCTVLHQSKLRFCRGTR